MVRCFFALTTFLGGRYIPNKDVILVCLELTGFWPVFGLSDFGTPPPWVLNLDCVILRVLLTFVKLS